MAFKDERRSLLAPGARIQVPWVKVSIGDFDFGVFDSAEARKRGSDGQYYTAYNIKYPNYIQNLTIKKINGQLNQYSLNISYPVRQTDDPNFFEKVFSSVSKTRKIVFSYGDMSMPTYLYKDEQALIVSVKRSFQLPNAVINYAIEAVSTATLNIASNHTFLGGNVIPSQEIKRLLKSPKYGLKSLFSGINESNIDQLVEGGDKMVRVDTKTNISTLDYITYLVSCMIPADTTSADRANSDLYVLTFHDDTTYDRLYSDNLNINGPYLKVQRISHKTEKSDAFVIDVGFGNTGTIVRRLQIADTDGYALMYDYNESISAEEYTKKINNQGQWEDVYAPTTTSKNDNYMTRAEDLRWWTKITKYPVTATIELQGLLRAAQLMSYVRLNIIFPSGHKHIDSGLYLVTSQTDSISGQGYITTLGLTKINGDDDGPIAQ